MNKKLWSTSVFWLFSVAPIFGQIASSPNFTLEKAVVPNGGGASSGITFGVEGTVGQSAAETRAGNFYKLDGGFWNAEFAPTVAVVTISGRVALPNVLNATTATVTLTDSYGNTRQTLTNKFGDFRFEDVAAGGTYILSVSAKRAVYAPQIISPIENIADLIFTPQ